MKRSALKENPFGTDGVRAATTSPLFSDEMLFAFGQALGMQYKSGSRIACVRDTRESGLRIEHALAQGLIAAGSEVLSLGVLPTPGLSSLINSLQAQGGVAITASHNPWTDNGLKLFDATGAKADALFEEKVFKAWKAKRPSKRRPGSHFHWDGVSLYLDHLGHVKTHDLAKRKKVVIDCAHGAAYQLAPLIFKSLGLQCALIGVQPNGQNINAGCGSTDLQALQEKVSQESADLGIAFDGDADRVLVVDEQSCLIDGDALIGLMALDLKGRGQLKGGVVVTEMTNGAFDLWMADHQIPVHRTAVGDKHVAQMMQEKNLELGGEQSGHIIQKRSGPTGDGMATALTFLKLWLQSKQKASDLVAAYQPWPQRLVNIPVTSRPILEKHRTLGPLIRQVQADYSQQARILVRYSGTEALCRVMVESRQIKTVKQITQHLSGAIRQEIGAA